MRSERIAVVGATGLVGRTVIEVLLNRSDPFENITGYATERSASRTLEVGKKKFRIYPATYERPEVDYAIFCAPGDIAVRLIPIWRKNGVKIIDNSSSFRMDKHVPLVVPEVNAERIAEADCLIANPNCSTIQLAVVAAPLHREFKIRDVRVSTYQSVSGAGNEALSAWRLETRGGKPDKSPFSRRIHGNVLPLIGDITSDGHATEELKLMRELPKILNERNLRVSATAVRVPVAVGHSEAVEFTFKESPGLDEVIKVLKSASGVVLELDQRKFPAPIDVVGDDRVFVGRLRMHRKDPSTCLMWIVADNLRKGAASNAVQILERWIELDQLSKKESVKKRKMLESRK